MKKVLFIITQAEIGGAQKHVIDLASELSKTGEFECAVASEPNENFAKILKENGVEFSPIKRLQRSINPLSDLFALFEIYNLIKSQKPDIVHLHSSKAGVLGVLAGRMAGVKKIVFTAHGWVFNEQLPWFKKRLYILISRFTALFQDSIICVSEYDKTAALKYKIAPEKKLFVIPNGINVEKLKFLEKEQAKKQIQEIGNWKLEIGNFIVGSIANLYKNKAIDVLIEAAREIKNKKENIKNEFLFLVIGEGKERENLELRIKNYELSDHFFLIGAVPEAWKYLKAFDIFVLPSLKEGFPYAILEAMAAGLPIVASKVGGIPEMIAGGENGLLIKPGDAKELAAAILRLSQDEEMAKKLGNEAERTVKEKFGLQEMVKKTTEVYKISKQYTKTAVM